MRAISDIECGELTGRRGRGEFENFRIIDRTSYFSPTEYAMGFVSDIYCGKFDVVKTGGHVRISPHPGTYGKGFLRLRGNLRCS